MQKMLILSFAVLAGLCLTTAMLFRCVWNDQFFTRLFFGLTCVWAMLAVILLFGYRKQKK